MVNVASVILVASSRGGEIAPEFTIATFNIHFTNTNLTEVVRAIRSAKADLVCLQETTVHSERALRMNLSNEYPFAEFHAARGAGGFGILSKTRLTELRFIEPQHGLFGTWIARSVLPGTNIQIAVVHLRPPNPARMDSLSEIVNMFKEADKVQALEISRLYNLFSTNLPTIIVGDFNSFSFFSAPQFLRQRGFTDSFAAATENADSHGTWCRSYQGKTWCFRIDYIFHTPELQTIESRIIVDGASDHRLLVSKLRIGKNNNNLPKPAASR